MSQSEFGKALREARTQAGFSIGRLARALGVSTAYVQRIERGGPRGQHQREGTRQSMTQPRIIATAAILKCSPVPLLAARARETGFVEIPSPSDEVVLVELLQLSIRVSAIASARASASETAMLRADRAEIERMLAELPDSSVIERLGLEHRRSLVDAVLAARGEG